MVRVMLRQLDRSDSSGWLALTGRALGRTNALGPDSSGLLSLTGYALGRTNALGRTKPRAARLRWRLVMPLSQRTPAETLPGMQLAHGKGLVGVRRAGHPGRQ